MAAYCCPDPDINHAHDYYVVMIDYGSKYATRFEAVVDPWLTRAEVLAQIRDVMATKPILFIHHIHRGDCNDVTNLMLKEAGFWEYAG